MHKWPILLHPYSLHLETLLPSYLFARYLCCVWPHYDDVSVNGNQEDGEGGEEDTAGLDGTDHLAENAHLWSPGPVLAQNIYAGEWHGEGAEQDVRDGQGGDEHISRGQHHLQNIFLSS